jgi:hypothetical protein
MTHSASSSPPTAPSRCARRSTPRSSFRRRGPADLARRRSFCFACEARLECLDYALDQRRAVRHLGWHDRTRAPPTAGPHSAGGTPHEAPRRTSPLSSSPGATSLITRPNPARRPQVTVEAHPSSSPPACPPRRPARPKRWPKRSTSSGPRNCLVAGSPLDRRPSRRGIARSPTPTRCRRQACRTATRHWRSGSCWGRDPVGNITSDCGHGGLRSPGPRRRPADAREEPRQVFAAIFGGLP